MCRLSREFTTLALAMCANGDRILSERCTKWKRKVTHKPIHTAIIKSANTIRRSEMGKTRANDSI